ncbi:hypothetical protein DITRI_Ditri17bG0017900 [Diplodiscus trichospermus]
MYSVSIIGSLLKKLGRSKPQNSDNEMREAEEHAKTLQARRGYVAMYVGDEAKRYEVPIKYLSSPLFRQLLIRSQDDDLEAKIDGPITIDCTPEMFKQLLKVVKHDQCEGKLVSRRI